MIETSKLPGFFTGFLLLAFWMTIGSSSHQVRVILDVWIPPGFHRFSCHQSSAYSSAIYESQFKIEILRINWLVVWNMFFFPIHWG